MSETTVRWRDVPELERFAREHGLRIGTIADLIRHRLRNERSVERVAHRTVTTEFGEFRLLAYQDHVHRDVHLALVCGDLDPSSAPLVRVHLVDTSRDVLGVQSVEEASGRRRWTLRAAMQRIAREGSGVIVILREVESPRELADAAPRERLRSRARTVTCCARTVSAHKY
jgi:3,4-dihydroxy 2-butanone 4-phosphate synthase/GTP cyclohydrolase II